jgi:hypothetical protein
MKRAAAIAGALALVAAGGVAFAAVRSAEPPARLVPSAHATRFYTQGPSADCGSDFCGIGVVPPLPLTLPAGQGRFRVRVLVSLQYDSTPGEFEIDMGVRAAGAPSPTVLPARRLLAASARPTSTTLEFITGGLRPGVRYLFSVGANVHSLLGQDDVRMHTSNVVVDVEAFPAR